MLQRLTFPDGHLQLLVVQRFSLPLGPMQAV